MNSDRLGVVGATGAVGSRLLSILEGRSFPVSELRAFASEKSKGKKIAFSGREIECQILRQGCFDDLDFVFFDASDEISQEWVPEALKSGCWVIDNSSVYRMNSKTPLVVPEVNEQDLFDAIRNGERLFAGPNCSTVQLVMALSPLRQLAGLKRVVVATYQSVSGAGAAAMDELRLQASTGRERDVQRPQVFPHQIAFNLIPRIGKALEGGFTSEELKLMRETQKILGMQNLPVVATAVRVPTLISHAESVFVEFDVPLAVSDAHRIWRSSPGIEVMDDLQFDVYPRNDNTADQDSVAIGRVRQDPSVKNGLCFWVVSDNLRKGAALNAVQIAESVRRISARN